MDPPTGGPEPPPTNTQETPISFSVEDFQPRVNIGSPGSPTESRKRTRSGDAFAPSENSGRVTTKEVWKLIGTLKDIIRHQTAVIESTHNELQEIKHNQHVLQEQNEKLHEEVKALRAQVESAPAVTATRTWAAVAATGDNATPSLNHQKPEKEQNCVRISTQRAFVDPRDNDNNDGNAFGRYLPTDTVNTHIRTALQSDAATQDAQVVGIGTTKTGYLIRFKNVESAQVARNNTEWLHKLGNNTKLVKPRFGVVVHRTPTEEFNLETGATQAAEKIIEDNDLAEHGFHIEELAWMKAKDKALGKFASLGIWFDSAEGAEHMLRSGFVVSQHYIPQVERREIKKKRCFRCQRFGHLPMLEKNLRILQLNMMKSGPRMEALINDPQSLELDVLLIQEPSITTYRTHISHSAWRLYRPTTQTDAVRFRSLLYVNRRISTSSHCQLPCDHPDVAAIKIWTADSQTLVFSVYIPPVPLFTGDDSSALPALTAIQNSITTATQHEQRATSIIVSGDFNRHHPMWGNNYIAPRFIEDASDLIDFFQAHNLHSCLPRGTATYWAFNNPGQNSTIDQTVTDSPDLLVKCHLYHENYGSDHRATYSEWNLQPRSRPKTKARKAYERADWTRIGEEVARQMNPWKQIKTRPTLDRVVENLTAATAQAVDRFTPDTCPTPYSKRWFTPDLKTQQVEVNQLRRRWQANCAELGREHANTTAAFEAMQQKRRAWTRTIEKAKSSHWKQFLDEAGEGKLWKAATYMKPRETWDCVPALRVGSEECTQNEDKAKAFLDAFFPAMNPPEFSPPTTPATELPWHPITESEIERSLKAAKGNTAPGEDTLPMLVWKKLWRHLKAFIVSIFTASVELGHHPRQWRSAKIIVLRKPGKPDYSKPGAYRPISLLNTLGKLLEAVMARRLSYVAEKHGLLPNSQFGGRPGRTTEQALLVLSSAIDKAWYKHKVVTLVAFDLKGAFNGVNKTSLDASLQARRIPIVARKWIASFMSDRHANIGFDDFRTETQSLANAGLAQGSPLSPILFAFFNADLVDQPVDSHGGASAFIDDYFRWRVGRSAEENLTKIQSDDVPRIEEWARRTGSCFAAEKTELIHLTRKRGEHMEGRIIFDGADVKPSPTAKLLGVVFDQGLRWKEHVQQAIKRATKTAIALSGLRHLRPEQMRQLYQACVAPIVDYASTVWHDPLRDKVHIRHLNTVQRTVLIRILSAFRTVATATLEVEAYILPTHLRLRHRAQRTIARLHTLPRDHPIWSALSRAQNRRNNVGSYARFPLAEALKTMDVDRLNELETIDPRPLPPWRPDAFTEIELEHDRETARERAKVARNTSDIVVYSDASGREGHLGAAIVALNDNDEVTESQQVQVGSMERWSVHVAELMGIFYAVSMAFKLAHQRSVVGNNVHATATILCDSKSALQAIQNVRNRSGQRIIHASLQAATEVQARHITLRLQWMPGHCEIVGNEAADRLAKEAAQPGKTHPFRPLLTRENAFLRSRTHAQWEQEWRLSTKGAHLRKVDGALPARYTRKLYGNLPRNRAYLLTQLRTGHNWLSTYAKKFGFHDDDRCECGGQETVSHVLLECPNLRELRIELRRNVGDALNSVSSLLGGSNEGEKGNPDTASRAKTVQAVLDFAEASQRFRSRAPQGQPNNGSGNGPG
ncbi:uncharacterized protein N7515_003706 [Penicillium bovifimosum]|uniref:Reverse transcriptase n=1 Tax=Penicillium bovifimosum TaxID=126998 RepID=A0A9W9H5C4_9EURO|nr:uncharacterized protein N7515_003706 [Penicillium bovifimosum]KAJ5138858.1 hypothetical protein N7515_003706 [Penicillium bovifimosum]